MNTLYRLRKFSGKKLVGQTYFVSRGAAEVQAELFRAQGFTCEVAAVQPRNLVPVS